jgi:hypothetical protein
MKFDKKILCKCLVVSIALVVTIMIPVNTALASTGGYFTIKRAIVNTAGLTAVLQTDGKIPTDGSGGAFGYGILTDMGLGAVIVATTHQGVRDSVAQGAGAGPVWHTHFVQLGVGVTGLCGTNPEVVAITFQQPGRVLIAGSIAIFNRIPSSFTGTDALTGNPLTLSPGHNVQNVVSFKLDPKFQAGSLKAVCIEDITPAQQIIKNNGGIQSLLPLPRPFSLPFTTS